MSKWGCREIENFNKIWCFVNLQMQISGMKNLFPGSSFFFLIFKEVSMKISLIGSASTHPLVNPFLQIDTLGL